MNHRTRVALQAQQSRLRRSAWATYDTLVTRVISDYVLKFPATFSNLLAARQKGDWTAVLLEADALSSQLYDDAALHFAAHQVSLLIRKFPFPREAGVKIDPQKAGEEKFLRGEAKCQAMNDYFHNEFDKDSGAQDAFAKMRAYIRYVIGDEPPLKSIWERCDFGPGASVGVHGNATNIARKLASGWSVSPAALVWAYAAVSANWHLFNILLEKCSRGIICYDWGKGFQAYLRIVTQANYNILAFVTKTALTMRSIAIEPLLNGYVQKGVDVLWRQFLLQRANINISDQSLNQLMAYFGSLDDSEDGFVTIDLDNASSSICRGLCNCVLPPEWYAFLDSIRSKYYMMAGTTRKYHMFCSMGNGFCFPLETLLFTAACKAVGAGTGGVDFHVYGDDIIVRKRFAADLIALLGKMGFGLNVRKTFVSGPFRESCGADWFNGEDVRPYTLDEPLDSIQSINKFLNLTNRNARTISFFAPYREQIQNLLPRFFTFLRPRKGPPDSGIDVDLDQCMSFGSVRWDSSFQCWSWRELGSSPIQDRADDLERYEESYLYGVVRGHPSSSMFTVRRKTKTTVVRVATDTDRYVESWAPGAPYGRQVRT